jgi:serine/threonine protein kinase/glyoxylase-like metal-dependent hydrolase (beta-lactamase superfamily II)
MIGKRENDWVGALVGNKYRIVRVIGEGGMGVVCEAIHLVIKRRFAIKFLRSSLASRGDFLARFHREAQATGALESENIAAAIDFGILGEGTPYIVMEYLIGESLGSLLAREGPLPMGRAADLCLQACHGMEAAHAQGIFHRDLKPDNLFICQRADGTDLVKVLDFGIAKLAQIEKNDAATRTGTILGTPAYMSPEQARGDRTIDHRTDVYGLAAILFEMLSGQRPHLGHSPIAILNHIAAKSAVPLRAVQPDLPASLLEAVDRALSSDPNQRHASVAAFGQAVMPFAKRERWPAGGSKSTSNQDPTAAPPPERRTATSTSIAAGDLVQDEAKGVAYRGGRQIAILVGATFLALAAAAVMIAIHTVSSSFLRPRTLRSPQFSSLAKPQPTTTGFRPQVAARSTSPLAVRDLHVGGNLDKDIVRQVIESHDSDVMGCYLTELLADPTLFGRIVIGFTISASGQTTNSILSESTMGNRRTEACMLRAVRGWQFPPPGRGDVVTVSCPFILVPATAFPIFGHGPDSIEIEPLDYRVVVHRSESTGGDSANGLVVVTKGGLLLIDTGWTEWQTKKILRWGNARFGLPWIGAIITHEHVDRDGGLSALFHRGIPVAALDLTVSKLALRGIHGVTTLFEARAGEMKDARGFEAFYPGPGHTSDNIAIAFPDADVLFAGCLLRSAVSVEIGGTGDTDLRTWPVAVQRLASKYKLKWTVPGHGLVTSGDSAFRNTLELLKTASK